MTKIVEKSKIWFSISLIVILIGLGFMLTKGLNFGIDFKGGTRLVIEFGKEYDKPEVDEIVKSIVPNAVTKTIENTQYEIKDKDLDETKTNEVFENLKEKYSLEDSAVLSQTQIGASVGKELTRNSVIALLIACIAMLIYIAIRFKMDYGIAAVMALMHD
ncbi:protein translocase subunit SecF, partial [Clostridium saudiense]|nr:protein translocase subunit SecF [Clostridium saudiense]